MCKKYENMGDIPPGTDRDEEVGQSLFTAVQMPDLPGSHV
jgi:hypothetical protein